MIARPFYEGIRASTVVIGQRLLAAEMARADIPWWAFIRRAEAEAKVEALRAASKQLHCLMRLANHHPDLSTSELIDKMHRIGYCDDLPNEVFIGAEQEYYT